MAARCPPGPEPMTIKSYGCIRRVQRAFLFRGAARRDNHHTRSINDALVSQRGDRLRVTVAAGQPHKMFLRGKSVAVAHRAWAGIRAIRSKNARLARVSEIRGKNLVAHTLTMLRVFQRK